MKRKIEDTNEMPIDKKQKLDGTVHIVFSGDRYWDKQPDAIQSINDVLDTLDKDCVIIHGGCKGLDLMVDRCAKEKGFTIVSCPADWKKDGIKAGPIRNSSMLNDYNPRQVFCYHNDIKSSKGTKDMLNKCVIRSKKLMKEHGVECKNIAIRDCKKHYFKYKHITTPAKKNPFARKIVEAVETDKLTINKKYN